MWPKEDYKSLENLKFNTNYMLEACNCIEVFLPMNP
jgi:hypothetical protein